MVVLSTVISLPFFSCFILLFKELRLIINIHQLFALCSHDVFSSSQEKRLSVQISEIRKLLNIHDDYLALLLFII